MSSSRFSAARPKRAGEAFARTHHASNDSSATNPTKKPKFDVRNPSALAPDAPEEDAVLEADVIGVAGANTKRGAVNLDGYDSDSDNEGFDARADERAKAKGKKTEINLAEQLDGYTNNGTGKKNGTSAPADDEDDDMFGDLEDDPADETPATKSKKDAKSVRFLDASEIEGQVDSSKSGGHISSNFALDPKGKLSTHAMDDAESSDDEEDALLAAQEEDIDPEIGLGGLKRNAPKVDAFNMKAEQEEGRFDESGNFVRKAVDPEAKHDVWLEGVSKKEMKKAAEAHEKRESELRKKRLEDDAQLLPDILRTLILQLEKGETVLEALARLGKAQKKEKKIPKWKLKKQTGMDVDTPSIIEESPEQTQIKTSISTITSAADLLMTRGQTEIYELERESLIRQYGREAGEQWVEPAKSEILDQDGDSTGITGITKMWEYRWTDGRGEKQGPYDGATMEAWQDAGYFEGVEFRRVGGDGAWLGAVEFV